MIPRTFHRVWLDEPVPERYEVFWERFGNLHLDWELVTWNRSSELGWLQNRDLFDQARTWAGRADVVRYEVVYKFGGVYVDTDVEALRTFDELLEDERPFAGLETTRAEGHREDLICPTVIGAPAGHPALKAVIDYLPTSFRRAPGLKPNFQTGPVPFTRIWRHRKDVRILPRIAFYPVGWWEKDRLGGPYPPESYAVHHWDAGWKKTRGLIRQ